MGSSKIKKLSPSPPGTNLNKPSSGKVTILKASRINVRSSPSPSPDQSPPTHQTFKLKAGARSEEVSPGSGSGSPVEDESAVGNQKNTNNALVLGGNFSRQQTNKGDGGTNRAKQTYTSPNPSSQIKKIRVKGGASG